MTKSRGGGSGRYKSPTTKNPERVGGKSDLPQKKTGGVDVKKIVERGAKGGAKSFAEQVKKTTTKSTPASKLKAAISAKPVMKKVDEPQKAAPSKAAARLKAAAPKSKTNPTKAVTKKSPVKSR